MRASPMPVVFSCTRYTLHVHIFFSKNRFFLHPYSINHLKSKSDPARTWLHWKTQQILFTFFNRFSMHIVYRIQIDFIDKSVEHTYLVRVSLFSVKQSQMSTNPILKCCCYLNLSVMEFHSYIFIKYDFTVWLFLWCTAHARRQNVNLFNRWVCLFFFLQRQRFESSFVWTVNQILLTLQITIFISIVY